MDVHYNWLHLFTLPYSFRRSSCYTNSFYDFSVTVPTWHKNIYAIVSSVANDLKFRINRNLTWRLWTFQLSSLFFYLFLLFLVPVCHVFANWSYVEWIAVNDNESTNNNKNNNKTNAKAKQKMKNRRTEKKVSKFQILSIFQLLTIIHDSGTCAYLRSVLIFSLFLFMFSS